MQQAWKAGTKSVSMARGNSAFAIEFLT